MALRPCRDDESVVCKVLRLDTGDPGTVELPGSRSTTARALDLWDSHAIGPTSGRAVCCESLPPWTHPLSSWTHASHAAREEVREGHRLAVSEGPDSSACAGAEGWVGELAGVASDIDIEKTPVPEFVMDENDLVTQC